MTTGQISKNDLKSAIEDKLNSFFGVTSENATDEQVFRASAMLIRELMSRLLAFENTSPPDRQLHYLSMEFLLGRSLMKNAYNLGIAEALTEALSDMGRDARDIFETEPDAGLGNGGLGRLAACYMDSIAGEEIPALGYSLCYELGMFKQEIKNGAQTEVADDWRASAESWLIPRYEDSVEIKFGGRVEETWDYFGNCHSELKDYHTVLAVPRDMLICGAGGNRVNTLRLWEAHSKISLDMFKFADGAYIQSVEQRAMAEIITKVLYPADDHIEGKTLRLKQQYFFVSATAMDIVRKHRKARGDVRSFAEHNVIHINDTHPTMIIPELMRIFMDEDGLGWDEAWSIVSSCVAYTNHTVMSEALECWPQGLIQSLIPRIFDIISEINRRYRCYLSEKFCGDMEKVSRNAVIVNGQINMANLCLSCCFKVNGVSKLHGDILKNELFNDIFNISPNKFTYVTNGIDHRRWLAQVNPSLDLLLKELLGYDYLKRPEEFTRLLSFADDKEVLHRLIEIKALNKQKFSDFILRAQGSVLCTEPIFDVQVKRLHEYKRQLMCAMLIVHLQNTLRDNPGMDFKPRTFIFAAKAAAGYKTAKRIIELLCSISDDLDRDPVCKGRLSLLFAQNYRVSVAESLIPAAQVSEQISTAGKEASGTGNMKLMMNGAVTIGTLDGANVEMYERLGDDNMYLFGLRANEVAKLKKCYNPLELSRENHDIFRVLQRFNSGMADGKCYSDLVSGLVYGGDPYMLIADFPAYVETHNRLYHDIEDKFKLAKLSLSNIAQSGVFAADRAVREYAGDIWKI
ncbi:MAG: glycogen/starch/alpha-glucan phosphorylase [Ruminococcaceae bacterium]|nr:glycogen/starch/alpha-glucan phosphorylase [Oscillospiraceae bacterium]